MFKLIWLFRVVSSKVFRIYRSSAGSGKTRTLAKEYIKLALTTHPAYFKHILAVTFTNKATQEMKQRVIQYVNDFATGKVNDLSHEIAKELNYRPEELIDKSKAVQSAILHNYSQFAISTIDAFFQKVIRAFTREAGLLGNFRLEVENDLVLKEVIDELMDELGENKELTNWVVEFSRVRLQEGESWNILDALNGFAREIFKEQFQVIEEKLEQPKEEKNPYRETMERLESVITEFEKYMKIKADQALHILDQFGITADDFNYKDRGTALKYFREFSAGRYYESEGSLMQAAIASPNNWPSKKGRNAAVLKKVAEEKLWPLLKHMVEYDNQNRINYLTAEQILKNFFSFGLITDITRKLKIYKRENNLMLLSDAPKFLNGVINDSDTPFIYEKVGSYFRNYLIDEFQDTSTFQWRNFQPLLKEAIDQGQASVVVGDVKQSIYRWRGGDQQLLQEEVAKIIGRDATEEEKLNTNYRSADKIVSFNNTLFEQSARIVSEVTDSELALNAFLDVNQVSKKFHGKGYVQISFLEKQDAEDWTDEVLKQLPLKLEELQDKKIKLQDIAILVRKNEEGQQIATALLQYKNAYAKPGYRYDVVSNESLRLDTAASVSLLLSAMMFLHNPNDAVVRGQLAYEVSKGKNFQTLFVEAGRFHLDKILPQEFLKQQSWLAKLSIFELTEEIIRIFDLGKDVGELAYLLAFQDLVLEFSSFEKNDLATFLEWWESIKMKKSLQVAGNVDAVNIITIHKAKGLEFKFVIIPFLNWKLNHDIAPLLWVHTDQKPFDEMGYLAVRYSSSLTKTHFDNAYKEELVKVFLDNLNLLYVAFTRAQEGLVAYGLKPGPRQELKRGNIGDLVYNAIVGVPELAANFIDGQLTIGSLERLSEGASKDSNTVSLNEYASYDWREKLVIKREGAEFFLDEVSDKRASINYGILLHKILAHIKYKSEAMSSLKELHIQNVITEDELIILNQKVEMLMNHPIISGWFSKEWEILTEVPVLIPGGTQSRIDRALIGKKKTIVIDYKTGEKRSKDRKQVENYAGLLSEMGYPNVEAYLLYLDDLEIIEVVSGSTLSLEF